MKDSTRNILLASGGIVGGIILAGTGGGFLGLALGGALVRSGIAKTNPLASKEFIKEVTRTGSIVKNAIAGVIVTRTAVKLAADSGAKLGYEIAKMREDRLFYAPPPSIRVRDMGDGIIAIEVK